MTDFSNKSVNNKEPQEVEWHLVSERIAAGNVVNIYFGHDFYELFIDIIYGDTIIEEKYILKCTNVSYLVIRRTTGQEAASGMILEAYLHTWSSLLRDFFDNRLENKAGSLVLQDKKYDHSVKHLQIIGEINIELIFEKIYIEYIIYKL